MAIISGLQKLSALGFCPSNILDVGAYEGTFGRMCRSVWPNSFLLMIDALPEKSEVLTRVSAELGNAGCKIALLGDRDQDNVTFFVARGSSQLGTNQTGSSKYRETTNVPIEEMKLQQRTLDSVAREFNRTFSFVKLDIQGAEVEVLAAAPETLHSAEVILLELSLLEFNAGAPLIAEVLERMARWGFVLWDIVDHSYFGGHLNQIDGLFVRTKSPLRLALNA